MDMDLVTQLTIKALQGMKQKIDEVTDDKELVKKLEGVNNIKANL
jgi:hypothetical protein